MPLCCCSVGRSHDGGRTVALMEKAKMLDAAIEAAGGLAAFWLRRQHEARDRGERYYTRLVDPATDEVIAELTD